MRIQNINTITPAFRAYDNNAQSKPKKGQNDSMVKRIGINSLKAGVLAGGVSFLLFYAGRSHNAVKQTLETAGLSALLTFIVSYIINISDRQNKKY